METSRVAREASRVSHWYLEGQFGADGVVPYYSENGLENTVLMR